MKGWLWVVVTLLALVGAPTRAFAHAEFDSSDPEQGERLKRSPETIVLVFTEPPSDGGQFEIKDGCRKDVIRSTRVVDKSVRAGVGDGCPGRWSVDFTVVSSVDAHVVSGRVTFRVEKKQGDGSDGQPTESPGGDRSPGLAGDRAPGDDDGSGFPWFLVALGGGTVVGGALITRYLTKA